MPAVVRKIDHVIVLMLENRSFDHMLGFLPGRASKFEGLTGNEFNFVDPAALPGVPVQVSRRATYRWAIDPGHDVSNVNVQLFGTTQVPNAAQASNGGFVLSYAQQPGAEGRRSHAIMKCFSPSRLPVLSTLAQEFALCDHWFSSVPGPTWPNRFFVHAATSGGHTDNKLHNYDMQTIYDSLDEAGRTWRIYFHDIPQALALTNLRDDALRSRFRHFENFSRDVGAGDLPSYTFIEPRYFDFIGWKANDQHPPHDVGLGELLIADIYNSMRSSPLWNQSLLVILYDEHGGIYDHVSPPAAVSPDGKRSPEFDFKRLGVRVPAVLVSPLIPRGTVVNRIFEHSSVPATMKKLFDLPRFLTRRDAAAATFDDVASLPQPRTDTPSTLRALVTPEMEAQMRVRLNTSSVAAARTAGPASSTAPLSEFQQSLVDLADSLDVDEPERVQAVRLAAEVQTEHQGAVRVQEQVNRFLDA